MGNKLNNIMFPKISNYKFIKPLYISFLLLEESVFLFLEPASKLDINNGKYAYFVLNRFNFNDFRLHTYELQSKFQSC